MSGSVDNRGWLFGGKIQNIKWKRKERDRVCRYWLTHAICIDFSAARTAIEKQFFLFPKNPWCVCIEA
jgi:hypothetical protein